MMHVSSHVRAAAMAFCLVAPMVHAAGGLCDGSPAIITTWNCTENGQTGTCVLWGGDKARENVWSAKSAFVIERPDHSAVTVDYAQACVKGRCSRPEMATCSLPVTNGEKDARAYLSLQ